MAQVVGYSEISISEYADGAGLYDSIPYYLASSQSEGVTIYDEGWSREVPVLTPEEKYLWIYYVSRYSAGTTEPEILTVYGNPAVVEYEGDDAPADKVLVEIEPDIAQGIDQTPYIYRAVSDSSVTDLKNHEIISEITGGTVAWNQQVQNGDFSNGTNGWSKGSGASSIAASNGEMEITVGGTWNNDIRQTRNVYSGHIYFASFSAKADASLSGNNSLVFGSINSSAFSIVSSTLTTSYTSTEKITKVSANEIGIRVTLRQSGADYIGQKYYLKNVMLIDLTQMFGSTIADYIYSLEQSTAGAGVSLFKALFPKDYYAYNAGELMSVKTSARETTGKNLLNVTSVTVSGRTFNVDSDGWITAENKTSDPRPITYANSQWYVTLPKGTYFLDYWCAKTSTSGSRDIKLLLNDGSFVASNFKFGESGSVRFTLLDTNILGLVAKIYEATVRIQIRSADASTSYEPYQKHTYPLSNIELRGIPKLVNNKIQYDGDIYKADGSVTRRCGIVDLGTLNWEMYNVSQGTLFRTNISNATVANASSVTNAICALYPTVSQTNRAEKTLSANGQMRDIIDSSYTSASAFKTAMSGVYLVYELASPTTETANPYTEIQIGDADGTEEFIDDRDVSVPVGHKTSYIQAYDDIHMEHWGFNLFDKDTDFVTGKVMNRNGTEANSSNCGHSGLVRVFPNAQYYVNWTGIANVYGALCYDISKQPLNKGLFAGAVSPATITIPQNCYYVVLNVPLESVDSACFNLSKTTGSPKNGDYEPYYHENLSFSLGEPVYGGTVDVANYKTTKKYGMIDLGTLKWEKQETNTSGEYRFRGALANSKTADSEHVRAICQKYSLLDVGTTYSRITGFTIANNNYVYIYDETLKTATTANFKTAMSGVYLVYELAEPEESTFQP